MFAKNIRLKMKNLLEWMSIILIVRIKTWLQSTNNFFGLMSFWYLELFIFWQLDKKRTTKKEVPMKAGRWNSLISMCCLF